MSRAPSLWLAEMEGPCPEWGCRPDLVSVSDFILGRISLLKGLSPHYSCSRGGEGRGLRFNSVDSRSGGPGAWLCLSPACPEQEAEGWQPRRSRETIAAAFDKRRFFYFIFSQNRSGTGKPWVASRREQRRSTSSSTFATGCCRGARPGAAPRTRPCALWVSVESGETSGFRTAGL